VDIKYDNIMQLNDYMAFIVDYGISIKRKDKMKFKGFNSLMPLEL
jgi:hypothetical protein